MESARLSLLDFGANPTGQSTKSALRGWPVATLSQAWSEFPVLLSIEPGGSSASVTGADESSAPSKKPSSVDTLHQLIVTDDGLRLTASLELGSGYRQHAWGENQGYVLSESADFCDPDLTTELSVVRSDQDGLARLSRFRLAGHGWRIAAQNDQRVVLVQKTAGLARWVVVDVTASPEEQSRRIVGDLWHTGQQATVIGERAFLSGAGTGLVELQ